jgi:hypothetical protein
MLLNLALRISWTDRRKDHQQGVKPSKRMDHLDQDKKCCYTQRRRMKGLVSQNTGRKSNGEAESQESAGGIDASRVQLARSVRESRNPDDSTNGGKSIVSREKVVCKTADRGTLRNCVNQLCNGLRRYAGKSLLLAARRYRGCFRINLV